MIGRRIRGPSRRRRADQIGIALIGAAATVGAAVIPIAWSYFSTSRADGTLRSSVGEAQGRSVGGGGTSAARLESSPQGVSGDVYTPRPLIVSADRVEWHVTEAAETCHLVLRKRAHVTDLRWFDSLDVTITVDGSRLLELLMSIDLNVFERGVLEELVGTRRFAEQLKGQVTVGGGSFGASYRTAFGATQRLEFVSGKGDRALRRLRAMLEHEFLLLKLNNTSRPGQVAQVSFAGLPGVIATRCTRTSLLFSGA